MVLTEQAASYTFASKHATDHHGIAGAENEHQVCRQNIHSVPL